MPNRSASDLVTPYQTTPTGPVGTKLLADMQRSPDRYPNGQSRDFFAVLTR